MSIKYHSVAETLDRELAIRYGVINEDEEKIFQMILSREEAQILIEGLEGFLDDDKADGTSG